MSPLKLGPGSGSSRLLGPGSHDRCRTHRVPLGPARVPTVPGEEAAALRLAAEAAARLSEEGVDLPRSRPLSPTRARCPECVQEAALAAAARVHGDED